MDRISQLLQFNTENPNDSFIRFALALEYIKRGESDTAVSLFEKLIGDDPDYVGTYYHLGKLYQQLGRKDDALACFTTGIKIARKLNDQHSLAELQNIKMNIEMGIEED